MPELLATSRRVAANAVAFCGLALLAVSAHRLAGSGALGGPAAPESGEAQAPPPDTRQLVILDPGHGGADGGTVAGGSLEKEMNLEIARQVANRLRQADLRVELTRDDDSYVKLGQRSRIANREPSALFVSIHHNGHPTSTPSGIETYYSDAKPQTLQRAQRALFNAEPGERFEDRRGRLLASEIQRALCRKTGAKDRGIKSESKAMTRWVSCPAVLVECGFLSNPNERQKLRNPTYRAKISDGIAAGILAYLDQHEQDPLFGVSLPDRLVESELAGIKSAE